MFTLDVPTENASSLFSALSRLQWAAGSTGGQLVMPPPYSEQDPLSSPSRGRDPESVGEGTEGGVGDGECPPAYDDAVKYSVIATTQEGGGD